MTLIFTFTESLRRFWNEALRLSVVNHTPNAKTFPFTQGIYRVGVLYLASLLAEPSQSTLHS